MNQLDMPKKGETIAIFKTSMGDISIRLFEKETPKTFENFVTHARNGYYNGLKFHRVIKDFMIQGGDPAGNGTGGESIWGKPFEDEPRGELRNYCGALSMANAGPNTNGSQFFIVQLSECPDDMIKQMEGAADQGFSPEVTENYKKLGGTPWLDSRHTVFGHVFDGMDIVNKIANVKVKPNDVPSEDVFVNSIIIETVE